MRDTVFVDSTLESGKKAKAKVQSSFHDLSLKQFNWKPAAERWSIAQCLDHLVISDGSYFPDLQKIAEGKYEMTFWEKHSPFTSIFGKLMKDQLQEQVKRKMKTNKVLTPPVAEKNLDFIDYYLNTLDTFLQHISNCRQADMDSTIIGSPIVGIVTYSLRDALEFLIQHEHRHINQAVRIREELGFPKG